MAASSSSSSFSSLLLISCVLLLSSFANFSDSAREPEFTVPIAKGLSWNFYEYSCPDVERIIRKQLNKVFKDDIGQAAGLLRLHFHDCFVQVHIFFLPFFLVPIYLGL